MVAVYVDVDLEDFDDEDIKAEYESRGLDDSRADSWDELAEMTKAYQLHHAGKKDEAYEILWQHCLIKLNRIV